VDPRALTNAVAAYGLPSTITEFPRQRLDDDAWSALLKVIRRQRMSGHLAHAIARHDLIATSAQSEAADDSHIREMSLVLMLEHALLGVLDLLDANAIPYRVLKGSAVAHLDYADPSLRSFGDIDVLVPSQHFDAAAALLEGSGHQRRFPEPRPGFDRRFGKGTSFTDRAFTEIDLHRTFVLGPYGLSLDLDELWSAEPATFSLAGRRVNALAAEHRFLNACYHAVLGNTPPRLVPLRDVAELMLAGKVDIDEVRRLAERWRAKAVVALAVRSTWDTLGLADATALSFWAYRYEPEPWESRALSVYRRPETGYAARSIASIRVIRGGGRKLAFLRALAFPRRDYVEGRHRGFAQRWWRGARDVTPRRRRER
jgi:hypothetical protein